MAGIGDYLKQALIGLGLATSANSAPASEPVPVPVEQREALWRAQQVRNELAKIPKSPVEEAQEAKAILAFRCATEFKKVTDPVTGKIYAEPETKACVAFKPVEQKLSF